MTVVALLIPIAALAARSPTDVRRDAQQALEYVTRADGPGAVILIRRGDRTLARLARGRASLELDVALSADHVFAIASVTKIMTAALLVDLERDGRLALDDTLATHLPDFPNAQHVTLRQLLQHTSGISDRVPAPQPGFCAATSTPRCTCRRLRSASSISRPARAGNTPTRATSCSAP